MEVLSTSGQAEFAEIWYDIAPDDHFWVRRRFDVLAQEIGKLGVDKGAPLQGLDIGCGHGAVQRQLASHTAWTIDGCDLNKTALQLNTHRRGRVLFYNTNDRSPALRERYDFIVLFDVIEHIDDTERFLDAALWHLRPGGYAFINVPALRCLYSKYDAVVGHRRRYSKPLLASQLRQAGLSICSLRYWGMLMLPVAVARKLCVDRMSGANEIVKMGFHPPGRLISALFSATLALEDRITRSPPVGTSLFASARKPE